MKPMPKVKIDTLPIGATFSFPDSKGRNVLFKIESETKIRCTGKNVLCTDYFLEETYHPSRWKDVLVDDFEGASTNRANVTGYFPGRMVAYVPKSPNHPINFSNRVGGFGQEFEVSVVTGIVDAPNTSPEPLVNLAVFHYSGSSYPMQNVPFSPTLKPGHWSWTPKI
jgi:hypothetical protein